MLATAAVVAVAAGVLAASAPDELDPYNAEDPASESAKAAERLERSLGVDPDAGLVALVSIDKPVKHPATMRRVERVAERIFFDPSIGLATSVYETGDLAMVSRDRRLTYVYANFETLDDKEQQEGAERIAEDFADHPGVKIGGPAAASAEAAEIVRSDILRAQLIAFPLGFLLSLWFFRSVVAALLPLAVGGLSIAVAVAVLRLAAEVTSVSIFALNLVIGLGLGLAIDYSLLIVNRFREELAGGAATRAALTQTMRTAGRAVLFSSLTVAAAMAALLVFPQRFLYSMGIGGTATALVAGAGALLVLPALLAILGPRVNALAPRRAARARERDVRPDEEGGWYRLARLVMRRPGRIALGCAVLLIAAGIPALAIKFTVADARALPADTEPREVRDALESRFPPNPSVPIYVAARSRDEERVTAYANRLEQLDGAARVIGPYPIPDGLSLLQVVSKEHPSSDASEDLVRAVREVPASFGVEVGGRTADFVDHKESLAAHIPVALAVLALTTFVLLFLMTGSVVLPVKALVMNVLSLSAAFGLLVLIFQDGRLEGLLGYTSQGALESSMPLVLFAVAFGLSTDYGVFLLERIREARVRGADDREAVAIGLERCGRIVTAAALLLCIAIGAFATSEIIFIKQLGIGTALAVIIDATIVRALLVPALMELLGPWNWWAPGPLRRYSTSRAGASPHSCSSR